MDSKKVIDFDKAKEERKELYLECEIRCLDCGSWNIGVIPRSAFFGFVECPDCGGSGFILTRKFIGKYYEN